MLLSAEAQEPALHIITLTSLMSSADCHAMRICPLAMSSRAAER